MANRWFKILSASGLLLLYLSVMVTNSLSVMLCECHAHHHDHHAHHHVFTHHHDTHHCEKCDNLDICEYSTTSVAERCGCNHDHSNNIELYTFSRSWSDDASIRMFVLPALVADLMTIEPLCVADCCAEYGEYLLPPLSGVEKGSATLRAPPALV